MLQDKPDAGAFTFQVTLFDSGDIVFVYKVIPLMVDLIEDTAHPVKVGLSDAYIMDRTVFCKFINYIITTNHSSPCEKKKHVVILVIFLFHLYSRAKENHLRVSPSQLDSARN